MSDLIGGWIGAALRLEETDAHIAKRRDNLMWCLARYLFNATNPDTPAEEREAMLKDAVKFGEQVHARLHNDKAILQFLHEEVLHEAVAAGATACEKYQRRLLDANLRALASGSDWYSENRKRFLDELAPEPSK